jgi:hypothetical protein
MIGAGSEKQSREQGDQAWRIHGETVSPKAAAMILSRAAKASLSGAGGATERQSFDNSAVYA